MTRLTGTLASSTVLSRKGFPRLLTGAGSVAIHGVVLSALCASSLLHVEPLATPSMPSPSLVIPCRLPAEVSGPRASSPAPPPQGDGARKAARESEPAAPAADAAPVALPREQSQELPQPEAGGAGSGSGGDGPPGGVPDGVPWGIPGLGGGDGNGATALSGLPSDSPMILGAGVTPPEKIFHVLPVYPEVARQSRAEGVVILQVVVGRSGDVTHVEVLKSHPLFDAAAVEAVKRWKYKPAMLGAQPVRVYLTVRVEFKLK